MSQALLSFSLGPVQEFIAAARTTRDLWTGSYLLSWLTAHAMAEIVRLGGRIISPDVTGNPLVEAAQGKIPKGDGLLSPCLPQTFLARVQGDARAARIGCEKAVMQQWGCIADKVHEALVGKWSRDQHGWDQNWPRQIEQFWDIRTVAVPEDALSAAELQRLTESRETDPFKLHREYLGRLAAADKSIRHYPPHEFDEQGTPDTRPKCSLLGSFAQMGPLASTQDAATRGGKNDDHSTPNQMLRSREFWNAVVEQQSQGLIAGTRLGRRDRFCAISLVKRFAWGAYFAQKFQRRVDALPFPDVDTICAGKWLRDAEIDIEHTKAGDGSTHWSGHWLRWKDRLDGQRADAEEPEDCPDQATWNAIRDAKKKLGSPPTYYAVLMLDGDRMGELIRHADETELQQISSMLANFGGQQVKQIVESEHCGKLVYAGGDDVLALLPPSIALDCSRELAECFLNVMHDAGIQHRDTTPVTCSGGLVIAHYKANLRDVLQAARRAEHQAKEQGKNRLTIAVLKRSGEHTSLSCTWPQVKQLAELVSDFAGTGLRRGQSDRWAYHFRRELESALPDVPELLEAELQRLLGRAESTSPEFIQRVIAFWKAFGGQTNVAQAKRFTQLIQSASFLARGGKEER